MGLHLLICSPACPIATSTACRMLCTARMFYESHGQPQQKHKRGTNLVAPGVPETAVGAHLNEPLDVSLDLKVPLICVVVHVLPGRKVLPPIQHPCRNVKVEWSLNHLLPHLPIRCIHTLQVEEIEPLAVTIQKGATERSWPAQKRLYFFCVALGCIKTVSLCPMCVCLHTEEEAVAKCCILCTHINNQYVTVHSYQ